jgi:hypothetical protein
MELVSIVLILEESKTEAFLDSYISEGIFQWRKVSKPILIANKLN